MKEIQAENPVNVERVDGGIVISIPGDNPPLVPIFMGCLSAFIFFMMGLGMHFFLLVAAGMVGLVVYAFKSNRKTQVVKLINGKLIVGDKSYDTAQVSSIELGNSFANTPIVTSNSVYVGSGAVGMAGAAVGATMQNLAAGMANASARSGAKKGYYVRIVYGTKKYYLAKSLREVRAQALYNVLTSDA
ncbi:hypothetical protein [Pandoraea pnomenusa]|uniref:hypothetical protein n=1 Tax=Pandoraea pnomenusa TaxID=93220 RepID=UPI003342D289